MMFAIVILPLGFRDNGTIYVFIAIDNDVGISKGIVRNFMNGMVLKCLKRADQENARANSLLL